MRRLIPLLVVISALLALPTADAQEVGSVELTLVRQSPWNGPDRPLRLEVRAANTGGAALKELSLAVTVSDRVTSRTAYELSLSSDATVALRTDTTPLRGLLRPGAARVFAVEKDLRTILGEAGRDITGVFPVRVELRSAGIPVAVLRTPMVYLAEPPTPKSRLNLAWTFVLHHPIAYGPDGTFLTSGVERSIAVGAPLATEIATLARMLTGPRSVPVDVVISPPLLDQLERMRDGYSVLVGAKVETVNRLEAGAADAARVLGQIRAIAGSQDVEVAALPFAAPVVPALLRADIPGDFREQMERGGETVVRVAGTVPNPRLFYPPGSFIDQPTLSRLAREGVRLVLLEAGQLQLPPQDRGFAPPPTVRITAGPSRTLAALPPDPGVHALLTSELVREDPRLGAQAVLGELASIWLEQPGQIRGVAMLISDREALGARLFPPLVDLVSRAPFLRPVNATGMTSLVPPGDEPLELVSSIYPTFSEGYVARIREAHRQIGVYRSILPEGSPAPAKLERLILLAESDSVVELESVGFRFLDAVISRVRSVLDKVTADTSAVVTLTSRTGIIPLAIRNETGQPVRIRVRLSSSRLRFVDGGTREVELTTPTQTLTFQVEARSTGQFPVQVSIETPTGVVLTEAQLVVRSTAYSRIALIITLSAALFLLGRWARRFLPRARLRPS